MKQRQSRWEMCKQSWMSWKEKRKEAEVLLKEAQDENARIEQLLAISEQKYEQTEKAYKIAMEKKTVTPRAVSAGLAQQDLESLTQIPQRFDNCWPIAEMKTQTS